MTRRLLLLLVQTAVVLTAGWMPAPALAEEPVSEGTVVSASGRVLQPPPPQLLQPSVHAEMLADEGAAPMTFEAGEAPSIVLDRDGAAMGAPGAQGTGSIGTLAQPLAPSGLPNGLRKEVFGFLPYWMLTDAALEHMNYSLVSTIAYFSVGARRDGTLIKGTSTGWSGWKSSRMTEVINRAHANGVRVVLTVTMMGWNSSSAANQAALLDSASARRRLVRQIVNAVQARSVDGVNLDFEPVATSRRAKYVRLVKQLKAGLRDAGVGDYLTVCVMAGAATWATGYDVAGLTAPGAADALFVMGYDYHWSGSSRAGGVAPINSPFTIDVDGTMRDFLAETSGSKIIWGVPYYGRTWPTTSKRLNGVTRGGGSQAYHYTGHLSQARRYGRRWDDVGKVPWYRRWDASARTWVQGYYDDRRSLGIKYDLVNARGFAGTGMWTLLMDQGVNDLWRLLADKFVTDTAPPVGGISLLPPSVDGVRLKVGWTVVDHASGIDRYNVQVRRAGGAWQTWLSGTTATSAWFDGRPGSTYTFRVRGIDKEGNRQPWVKVPGKPATVSPGAFAEVVTEKLNVRSGAGTSFAKVATASDGDVVYVLDGPKRASGFTWYRVQFGFAEWPASDYARIGWMAVGSGGETYLAPAAAPTTTRFQPFVQDVEATRSFSPNGDGMRDAATIRFRLAGSATSVTLQIVNASGDVLRSTALGALGAGEHEATWNGRLTSGALAPEGRYLPRIVALDAEGTHIGPATTVNADLLSRFGTRIDLTAPDIVSSKPAVDAQLVAASQKTVIDFDEPMRWLGGGSIQLQSLAGDTIPASNLVRRGRTRVIIAPDEPLAPGEAFRVRISNTARDDAANRIAATTWSFTVAPGTAYHPMRRLTMEAGNHTAYVVGAKGALSSPRERSLDTPSHPKVGHRAALPNLPGRWLHVDTGRFDGRWLRESALDHLSGFTERNSHGGTARVVLRPGTHRGFRFSTAGNVIGRRSARLGDRSRADFRVRAIINGRSYFRIVSGPLAGYWLPESERVYLRGAIERIDFPAEPRLSLAPGRYTGYRYGADGRLRPRVTASLPRRSGATAEAWAIINGRPHFLIADGIWQGTWLRERASIAMDT